VSWLTSRVTLVTLLTRKLHSPHSTLDVSHTPCVTHSLCHTLPSIRLPSDFVRKSLYEWEGGACAIRLPSHSYACVYMYIHIHIYVYIYMYIYVHAHKCTYIGIYICTHMLHTHVLPIYMYLDIFLSMYIYMSMYVYLRIYIDIQIHIYPFSLVQKFVHQVRACRAHGVWHVLLCVTPHTHRHTHPPGWGGARGTGYLCAHTQLFFGAFPPKGKQGARHGGVTVVWLVWVQGPLHPLRDQQVAGHAVCPETLLSETLLSETLLPETLLSETLLSETLLPETLLSHSARPRVHRAHRDDAHRDDAHRDHAHIRARATRAFVYLDTRGRLRHSITFALVRDV